MVKTTTLILAALLFGFINSERLLQCNPLPNNWINGHCNTVMGDMNGLQGNCNQVFGSVNSIRGNGNGILGHYNTVDGHCNGV